MTLWENPCKMVSMEQLIIRQEDRNSNPPKDTPVDERALEFVGRHRDLYEHYARGRITIKPALAGVDTLAFNLENNTIYIHPRFYEKLGFSEEKTSFATLHEIEHLLEKLQMLAEKYGEQKFARYLNRIKKSKAYSVMDNCVADVRENRAVVSRTDKESGEFRRIEQDMYQKDLFKETDFTAKPRHLQLCYAILREARLPDQQCILAPEVREKLDNLYAIQGKSGRDFLDIMTNPKVPMSTRLQLQDQYIWPIVEELLKQDIEDNKKDRGKDNAESTKGKSQSGKPESGEPSDHKPESSDDPNDIFKDAYTEAEQKVPNAVPLENIEKTFKEWQKARGKNPLDIADQEYAHKIGVTKEQLQQYRDIVASLEQIKNPETNESIIEELRQLINRIIARRLRPAVVPRHPVEEGEELVDLSELVSQVKAGNLEPKAWETHEVKEKTGKKFGEIEITLVGDRSGSMAEDGGVKMIEQRKAAVLMMEALKEFADLCEFERVNLEKPLEVRSEIYTFQATSADETPVKKMSKELSEKERIEVATVLSLAPGLRTTDFVSLEAIEKSITGETVKKISDGKLKKIIIIFTDGISHGVQEVKNILEKLRRKGVVVIGVGITEAGQPTLETYAPDARLAETAEKLPLVLGELLKKHLSDI